MSPPATSQHDSAAAIATVDGSRRQANIDTAWGRHMNRSAAKNRQAEPESVDR